ncbi:MAG: cytidine deaminase [Defluviitaleaceae bacterium]|nr:cytidine deaminase [Defluviitaleaceae bacterium]MCL2238881.1 cytidine deaminase [Defluviitaleaceae bacterium]
MNHAQLAAAAVAAKDRAYAPYSGFHVGAALLSEGETLYIGCNIESAAYPATVCAERTALLKAVSEGERKFRAIAVAGSKPGADGDYCYPCGVCRQLLHEFAGEDFEVIVARTATDFRVHKWAEILPFGFGPKDLEG